MRMKRPWFNSSFVAMRPVSYQYSSAPDTPVPSTCARVPQDQPGSSRRAWRACRGQRAEFRSRGLFRSFDLVKNSERICWSQLAHQGGTAQPSASAAFRVHGNHRPQENQKAHRGFAGTSATSAQNA